MGGNGSAMAGHQPEQPRCANCGVEIPWLPAVHRGETYCCGGCAQGGPCYCSYDLTPRDDDETWNWRGGSIVVTGKNTIIARRFFDDVLARQSERAVDELIAPDAVIGFPTGWFAGPEGAKRGSAQMASAFPDRRVEVQTLVAEGDRVVAEWTLCGTQRRELLGVPPSGRRECIAAHSQFRIEDGQIVEHRMAEAEDRAASAERRTSDKWLP